MKLTRISPQLKRGFTLIELMVVIAILAALASIGYPTVLEQMNAGARQTATSNLKELGNMLFKFKDDHGQYPCDATADELMEDADKADFNFGELKGNHSNAYFRQFFYSASNNTEKPFFVELSSGGKSTKEGDEKLANGRALEARENAFSYVMRKDTEDEAVKLGVTSTTAPLAMTSLYPSESPYLGDKFDVDYNSFRGHFFVLRVDGGVKDYEDDVSEDPENEQKGQFSASKSLFPQTKRGRDTAEGYIILTPEF